MAINVFLQSAMTLNEMDTDFLRWLFEKNCTLEIFRNVLKDVYNKNIAKVLHSGILGCNKIKIITCHPVPIIAN